MEEKKTTPWAHVVLRLLKGTVYYDRDRDIWDRLLRNKSSVEEYFDKIGVKIWLDESEGFAFLTQQQDNEDKDPLPRLTRAMPLTFSTTLLCVLLRERLYQYESNQNESAGITITKEDIYELLRPYFKEKHNEEKQRKEFNSIIKKVIELGFLRELRNIESEVYKIEKIIKAKISADKLQDIKDRLLKNDTPDSEEK